MEGSKGSGDIKCFLVGNGDNSPAVFLLVVVVGTLVLVSTMGASGKDDMMSLDIQSDVSISDQQMMDEWTKKNLVCDEYGEGCSWSATVERGTVNTTNRGRHRQDNDENLLHF